jgi:hypothetical protein
MNTSTFYVNFCAPGFQILSLKKEIAADFNDAAIKHSRWMKSF